MMTIGSATGAGGIRPGSIGTGMQNDPVSKNIQQQIADAQKKMQEISSDNNLSLEEKMKKRQELQQEISNLNQQLRQHQTEQRRQQQAKQTSMDDMLGGTSRTGAGQAERQGTGLSQAGMQAVLSADASMKQARVQGSTAKQMQGRAGVLRAEIKQDAARGDTQKKEEELADLEKKAQTATASQISSLAEANRAAEEAAKAEQAEQDSRAGRHDKKAGKADKDQKDSNSRTDHDSRSGQKADTVDEDPAGNAASGNDGKVGITAAGEPVPTARTQKAEAAAAGQMGTYTSVDIRL